MFPKLLLIIKRFCCLGGLRVPLCLAGYYSVCTLQQKYHLLLEGFSDHPSQKPSHHQNYSNHPFYNNLLLHAYAIFCDMLILPLKEKSLSRDRLFATPWTVAYQAPPSMGFSRQECWSGLPFPSPGYLPNPGIEPGSPALQSDALASEPPRKLFYLYLL